jgi:hypothetical protein
MTLWVGVKHWRTALHRFYVYRKLISSPRSRNLKVIKKCVHLKCICVWCLDNWSRILWGKSFNTFSMARLKTMQFRLTLTLLFIATHAFFFSLSPFVFMICDWGSPSFLSDGREISDYDWGIFFILMTLDLCLLLIHRDLWNSQKWQMLFSVNSDLDFFSLWDSWPEPPPLLKFSSMEKVFNIDLNLQTFFSSIFICIF